jgi:hypothetical protein
MRAVYQFDQSLLDSHVSMHVSVNTSQPIMLFVSCQILKVLHVSAAPGG